MNRDFVIGRLEAGVEVFRGLLAGVTLQQALWRPAPSQWSLLEGACHLLDEEREDFRTRIDHVLHKPGVPWPAIDPPGWVTARNYAARDLAEVLGTFLDERRRSAAWLRSLEGEGWDRGYLHPQLGPLAAGDLLAAWAAHDCLHVRQLTRLHWEYLQDQARPFRTAYAGQW